MAFVQQRYIFAVSVLAILVLPGIPAWAGPAAYSELTFETSTMPINSGSGRLDILLFTGNAVGNPDGFPDPNGGMPGGGSTFAGDYPVAGDAETMTVGELLDWLHTNRGPGFNLLEVELDVNEPGAAKKHPITVDLFTIDIGEWQFRTSSPVVLDAPDNGSGYSDFVIRGLGGIDLTTFAPHDTISFHLEASDLDSGFEEFFISAGDGTQVPNVPEPGTMGLLGIGLGLTASRRRKVS